MNILKPAAVIMICALVLVGSANLPIVETNSYFTSSDSRDIVVYVKEDKQNNVSVTTSATEAEEMAEEQDETEESDPAQVDTVTDLTDAGSDNPDFEEDDAPDRGDE